MFVSTLPFTYNVAVASWEQFCYLSIYDTSLYECETQLYFSTITDIDYVSFGYFWDTFYCGSFSRSGTCSTSDVGLFLEQCSTAAGWDENDSLDFWY